MKGLLLKDAYQTWCYIRWIILVSIAMMLVGVFCMKEGSNFFMQYSGIMLGMLPMTLLAYDQNSRFSAYCAALPVTKEQIVGGKYLIGLCGMALAELLSMAALAAAQLLWGTVTVQLTVATLFQVAMLTLLGTNTLTTLGAADRFLAYYGQMLDELCQTLGEDCIIYVQSIPPVRPAAAEKKPGLASDVLRGVNEQLAQLAASKGCVYLDLWEALADGEGNLKEMIAAPDGVHLSAGNGYGAWVTYLRNHAKYSANNPWIMGSAYSAE